MSTLGDAGTNLGDAGTNIRQSRKSVVDESRAYTGAWNPDRSPDGRGALGLLRIIPILTLGLFGFAALAIMLAAIAGHTRLGDLILPMLAVPIFIPALIAGVKASR